MSDNGKGSTRRPMKTTRKEFERRWDRVFKSPKKSKGQRDAN